MTFSEYLNECMRTVQCNARELSDASGLSQTVISRYRSGDRVPALDSEQLSRIVSALVQLSQKHCASGPARVFTRRELMEGFAATLQDEPGSVSLDTDAFNMLIVSMNVNIKKLAQFISYDPSFISRIRNGQRNPSDPNSFVRGFAQYLTENCDTDRLREVAGRLYDSTAPSADMPGPSGEDVSKAALEDILVQLLVQNRTAFPEVPLPENTDNESAVNFVRKLSEFDLDEYIRAVHFDTLRIPTSPIQLPSSRVCYGIEEMKQGELDFFRQTVLSRSKEPIYMCSDMDMADMAEDLEFGKKWMFAIAAAIKKGLHLNLIHSLDRPFDEMMLGLESWIPLYMTGQVTSYYLPVPANKVYSHLHYVSGAAALTGECIRGHHNTGRYFLTNNKKEISFYHSYSLQLFGKAKPLMAIFTRQNYDRFAAFLTSSSTVSGARRLILSAPPLAGMPSGMLERILSRCGVQEKQAAFIRTGVSAEQKILPAVMEKHPCEIGLSTVGREEFDAHPVALSLSGVFPDQNIYYTWEEYQEHLAAFRALAQKYPLCTLTESKRPGFRNIQIHILKGKWVMVSKNVSPAIHFVIRHPRLRSALENITLPVVE